MATPYEHIGLNKIERALNELRAAYSEGCTAGMRRDQIKAFFTGIYAGIEDLGREADADIDALVWDLDTVRQSVDSAFVDAIDAEEAAEPRIDPVRQFGTYNTLGGRVA